MENELPKGWIETNLGNILALEYGKSLPKSVRHGGKFPVFGSNGIVGYHSSFLIEGPGIIVGRKGSHGEVTWSNDNFFPIDTTYYVSTKKGLDLKLAYYLLKSLDLKALNRSTAIPGLNREDAYSLAIKLPPISEQQRIVAKLDELMEKINRSRTRIERIPKILKRFRQSVLASAISSTGKECYINDVCKLIQIGPFGTQLHRGDYISNGIPLINPTHIQGGEVQADLDLTISQEKFKELSNYHLLEGDVIMGRRGEMARCALIGEKETGWVCGTGSLFFRGDKKKIIPQYLYWLLSNSATKEFLEGQSKGTTMNNLNLGIVRFIPIRLPSISEQHEIIRKITKLFILADKIQVRYNQAKVQFDKLPQSLIAKAFRGELVTQNDNDDPAATLLEQHRVTKTFASIKKGKTKEYSIEPFAGFDIAAESIGPYEGLHPINIPENKKAFAKQVLGGKIVSLFKDDPNFTHIKFQKLQYLAEHLAEVDLNWNYYRQSAGPYDPKFMHTVAMKLKASKWFEERKRKFYPLEKVDKIEGYYDGYFKPAAAKLEPLFTALKNATEDEAEIVATLYAVWNNMIIKKETVNDKAILSTFFEWSDRKKKYSQAQVTRALAWMKVNGFMPTGFGKVIKEKKS